MTAQFFAAAEIDYMLSLLRPLQAMYGEAAGLATARFGNAVALSMPANPDPAVNRVLGFGETDLPLLDGILDWYRERRTACRFDLLSGAFSASLSDSLLARGFASRPLETFLSGPLTSPILAAAARPKVQKLDPADLNAFASAFLHVYPQDTATEEAVRICLKAQYSQPEWHCYLASVEGTVAAFGAMYVHEGSAALISAATLPAYRRQGCQTALLSRRRADAARLGCTLAWSHAACGSIGGRNMARQGMRPACVKFRWERPAA